jgi:antitoxin (DNA-binding transcriptional repressor) of toxin-antitoxin stability system
VVSFYPEVTTLRKPSCRPKRPSGKPPTGRASIGIRALKTNASAIVKDVRTRRVTYAVTRRGSVEALIVPVDAGERLLTASPQDSAWNAWDTLATTLASEAPRKLRSATAELARMRR